MATLIILIGLLPSLLCELPAIPIKLSKETTFITEPLAGDGLPNYALALQESLKACEPVKNGAIPFWQAMGQCDMSDEEFERLTRAIGLSLAETTPPLVQLQDESILHAVIDWLRETGRSSDDEELKKLAEGYVEWVQANPWTDEDVPPLAKWLAENEQALDLLVEASRRPQFYSPYPNLLIDRTKPVTLINLNHATAIRHAARALMVRAMHCARQGNLDHAWNDCRACLALGNQLASCPSLIEGIVAISVRMMGLRGTQVVLSQPKLSPLVTQVVSDLTKLDRPIDLTEELNTGDRLQALDYTLRIAINRLGGLPKEEHYESLNRIVNAGVNLNLSLSYINERYDRLVKVTNIEDRDERMKQLVALEKEFAEKAETVKSLSLLAGLSQTLRSNIVGEICFLFVAPDFVRMYKNVDQHAQYSSLVRTAAALAVYKAKHGRYPKELTELSPSIVAGVSKDLYTDGPLQYKRTNDGFLLYSLFENQVDDSATDLYGEIREGEWQPDKKEIDREKCDLVIRMPVPVRPLP